MDQFIEFIKNHWELWAALIVILGILSFEEIKRHKHGGTSLAPAEMTAVMNHEETVVIDVRPHAAFQKGHILNAVNIQKADFTLEKIARYKNQTIIIVDENGLDAVGISAKIKKENKDSTQKVCTLNGGINAWCSANLPLVKK